MSQPLPENGTTSLTFRGDPGNVEVQEWTVPGESSYAMTYRPLPYWPHVVAGGVPQTDGRDYTVSAQTLTVLPEMDLQTAEELWVRYDYLQGSPTGYVVEATVTNYFMWWQPDDYVLDELSRITQWTDSSGNSRHGNQTSAVNRPVVNGTSPAGLDAVLFSDPTSMPCLSGLFDSLSEAEVFAVLKANADSAGPWDWGALEADYNWHPQGPANGQDSSQMRAFSTQTHTVLSGPVGTATGWHVLNVAGGAGHWHAQINGVTKFETATNTFSTRAGNVGLSNLSGFSVRYWEGRIAEIIVVDHILTADERDNLTSSLMSKHGIT